LFAYLEDVHPDGAVEYLTEGCLRASHRALADAPFDNLGLPYHPSRAQDLLPGSREPVELALDFQPISCVLPAGHRLRLRITGADADNALTPRTSSVPRLNVHCGLEAPSALSLPVASGSVRFEN
jgi:predicted acyl esterase